MTADTRDFDALAGELTQQPFLYVGALGWPGWKPPRTFQTESYADSLRTRLQAHPEETVSVVDNLAKGILYMQSQEYRTSPYARKHILHAQWEEAKRGRVTQVHAKVWFKGEVTRRSFLKRGIPYTARFAPGKRNFLTQWHEADITDPSGNTKHMRISMFENEGYVEAMALLSKTEYAAAVATTRHEFDTSAILTQEKHDELDGLVQRAYGERLEQATQIKNRKNKTYHVFTLSGRHAVLKEFAPGAHENFSREVGLLSILGAHNSAPEIFAEEGRILLDHAGTFTLLDIMDEKELARRYDEALGMNVALAERFLIEPQLETILRIPSLTPDIFESKYRITPPKRTSHITLIAPTRYNGHYRISEKDDTLRRIDLENAYIGPVELSLANLILGAPIRLSEEFIRERAEKFIRLLWSSRIPVDAKAFKDHFEEIFVALRDESANRDRVADANKTATGSP
jgi:hypothetical protein